MYNAFLSSASARRRPPGPPPSGLWNISGSRLCAGVFYQALMRLLFNEGRFSGLEGGLTKGQNEAPACPALIELAPTWQREKGLAPKRRETLRMVLKFVLARAADSVQPKGKRTHKKTKLKPWASVLRGGAAE